MVRSTNLRRALTWWASALGAALFFASLAPRAGSAVAALLLSAAATQAVLVLVALGGASLGREPLVKRLGLGVSDAGLATILLLVVGFLGTSQCLESILELAQMRETGTLAQLDAAFSGARGPELALSVFVLGVAPGLGEELFARGWIQRGLVPLLGPQAAVLIAAAVFGALHADRVHSAAAFVLGLYLGAAVELTQSLRVSILCHITNNLVWVMTAAYGSSWLKAGGSPRTQVALGLCGAFAGALGLGVAFRGRRLRGRVAAHRKPVTGVEEEPQQP
ncbi:MAG TPA: type II CAAX endopeptidase family protein [Myxococcota bacterium]|nr:type II CAAX endopeptidase family protein [Myxococcota bacterium]